MKNKHGIGITQESFHIKASIALLISAISLSAPYKVLAANVSGVRLGEHGDSTRVVLDTNALADVQTYRSLDGLFIIVDMPSVSWSGASRRDYPSSPLIRSIDTIALQGGGTRMTIAGARPIDVKQTLKLTPSGGMGHRLVFDVMGASPPAFVAGAVPAQAVIPTQAQVSSASGGIQENSSSGKSTRFYIQGEIGAFLPKSFDIEDGLLTMNPSAGPFFGLEIGAKFPSGLRNSIEIAYSQFDLSANLLGYSMSGNQDVLMVTGGTYFDFNNESKFTPYTGVSAGIAYFKDINAIPIILKAHAGLRYEISDNVAVGGKYTFGYILPFTENDYGIKVGGILNHTISTTLSLNF